ncbi:beta-galactosidase [Priestia megaterium]|uniref:beta-galactosidase n=1 Tax=Priestia megaterium TaxID=1404 RepID=UPI000BF96AB6|nr:beta-galactosidase [Priestia megaterium]PFI59211.1 beta-galactosidase [Priestia megaterium]
MEHTFRQMLYGGDYNPEQWPEELWLEDMRIFKKANINSATINVFSWVRLQPSEEEYCFEELDKIIDMLSEENYDIVLATSTASLPAWMVKRYPDVTRTDFEGRKYKFGGRHNFCPNSPTYQRYSVKMAEKLAQRYGSNPNICCWHICNEYHGECYCDNCEKAFRVWVKHKYKTIEALNEAWNMDFWGHSLQDWDEIVVPNALSEHFEPRYTFFSGISIDYKRFNSEGLMKNYMDERDAVRRHVPNALITTNLMGTYKPLDYFKWAKEMDIVSWDNYPSYDTPVSHVAMSHDLMRGLKSGKPFMLMEQTPSQQNWQPYNSLKRPGKMRAQSYQAIAHGADTIQFFQLRRSRGACEKFHGAVIEHVGHEDTRVFRETAELGKELSMLGDRLIDSTIEAKVGILFDWENWWALEYTSGPHEDLSYLPQVQAYYDALYKKHIPVDMVGLDDDFTRYDLLIAPVLYMTKRGLAEKLEDFVEAGGHFITTFMSGIVDENDNVILGGYPGELRDMLGIWVEEIDALLPEDYNTLYPVSSELLEKNSYKCNMLCDIIHLEKAKAIAYYGEDFYKGTPVITKNEFGKGIAYYIGSNVEQNLIDEMVFNICLKKGISRLANLPSSVEITCRNKKGSKYYFVINHSNEIVDIENVLEGYTDLLTNRVTQAKEVLNPYSVKILVKE